MHKNSLARIVGVLLGAAACSSSATEADPRAPSAGATDPGAPDAPEETAATDAPRVGIRLSGLVLDLAGVPWPSPLVSVCGATACFPAHVSADGTFERKGLPAGDYDIDARGKADGGRVFSPVRFALHLGADLALGEVRIPETPDKHPVADGPQRIAVTEGLTVEIDGTWLTMQQRDEPKYLAAARVPEQAWPRYDSGGLRVLAIWAMNPFAAVSSTPIPVEIVNGFGLAKGAAAQLLAVDERGRLVPEAAARVSADGATIHTAPNEGLTHVTWLALAVPP